MIILIIFLILVVLGLIVTAIGIYNAPIMEEEEEND